MTTRKFTTSVADAGHRIDDWLAKRLGVSDEEARRLVGEGAVYVDGRREVGARTLGGGEKIAVHEPPRRPEGGWRVVHEEAEIVVVEKPPGLPVVRGRAGGAALAIEVARRFPGARPFHRIDEGTSGLVLFTREGGARRLAAALAAGKLVRDYLAVVAGSPPDRLVLDAPIGPDPSDRRRMKAGTPGGKAARTDATVVRRAGGRALVRARLSTGLTHQVRVHLAAAGHPVVGDALYGGEPAARLMLHAAHLSWPGGPPGLEAPLPAALDALVTGA